MVSYENHGELFKLINDNKSESGFKLYSNKKLIGENLAMFSICDHISKSTQELEYYYNQETTKVHKLYIRLMLKNYHRVKNDKRNQNTNVL